MNGKILCILLLAVLQTTVARADDAFHWPLFLSAITGSGAGASTGGEDASTLSNAVVVGLQKVVASDPATALVPGGTASTKSSPGADFDICTSGSASVSISTDATSGTIDYANCTIGYGEYTVTLDGQVSYSFTGSTFILNFESLTITGNFDLPPSTLSGEFDCTLSAAGGYDCSYSVDTFCDGIDYAISNAVVSGDPDSGYMVSFDMSSDAYGTLSVVTTSPITFHCTNGFPDSGSVTWTGADGSSGSITFDNCTSYTVVIDGVSTTYTW